MRLPSALRTSWLACALLLLLIGAGLGYWISHSYRIKSRAPQKAVYVWQEAWSPEVTRAVEKATAHFDQLMIFAGEIRLEQNRLLAKQKQIEWPALARGARPVTLVLRADDRVLQLLNDAQGRARLAEHLRAQIGNLRADAQTAGVYLAGIQLDFDCPTSRLDQYRGLIEAVRPALNKMEFSITALPTWMISRQFRALVQGLSYFVLQVHSIQAPRTIQETVHLVSLDQLDGWFRQASATRVPFYVALPTYGYRLFFNRQGRCTGFSAEGPRTTAPPDMQMRVVNVQPEEMVPIVQRLTANPPRHCQGIVWFRLPVPGDSLNWSWPTLQAVMAGRTPQLSFTAELHRPSPGLFEVWVANTGEAASPRRLAISVPLGQARPLARDAMGGWRWSDTGSVLEGPAPDLGGPRMAAWFRLIPKTDDPFNTITLGKVEILP